MPNTFDRGYIKLQQRQRDARTFWIRRQMKPHGAAVARGDRLEALIRGHQEGRRAAAGATQFRSFDANHITIIERVEMIGQPRFRELTGLKAIIEADDLSVGYSAMPRPRWTADATTRVEAINEDAWNDYLDNLAAEGRDAGLHAEVLEFRELAIDDLRRPRTFTLAPLDEHIGVDEAAAMAPGWDDGPIDRLLRRFREESFLRRQANDNHRHPLDGIDDPYGA